MTGDSIYYIAALMMLAAALYTSVGHAGASAYLAIMALFGVMPEVMKPTALVLNILVASLASWRFYRAGLFQWRLAWPFLLGSVPLAFLGGSLSASATFYRPLVGAVLLIGAIRLLWPKPMTMITPSDFRPVPTVAGVGVGAGIGWLSGLTGTGGGIFLSPILLFLGWTGPRMASGVAAVFILCNSIAGLAGNLASVGRLPSQLPWLMLAVMTGALFGTRMGISILPPRQLVRALGLVLIVAGLKLILT